MFAKKFDKVLEEIYELKNEKVKTLNTAKNNKSLNPFVKSRMIEPVKAEVEVLEEVLTKLNKLRKEI